MDHKTQSANHFSSLGLLGCLQQSIKGPEPCLLFTLRGVASQQGGTPTFQVESGLPDETFQLNLEILQWSAAAL